MMYDIFDFFLEIYIVYLAVLILYRCMRMSACVVVRISECQKKIT